LCELEKRLRVAKLFRDAKNLMILMAVLYDWGMMPVELMLLYNVMSLAIVSAIAGGVRDANTAYR